MSYHVSPDETVRNAAALVRAGAQAVKLEGGRKRLPMIEAIVDAEIPVMGHLGLTPQSLHAMGGFKVQGREAQAALELVSDAKALAHAGCFAIVLEGVPDQVARLVTEAVDVPTIGIGAGPVLRRPGAGVPRPARHRGAPGPQVRASLRLAWATRRGRARRPTPPTCARAASPTTPRATTSTARWPRRSACTGARPHPPERRPTDRRPGRAAAVAVRLAVGRRGCRLDRSWCRRDAGCDHRATSRVHGRHGGGRPRSRG